MNSLIKRIHTQHPNVTFWGSFLLLNGLLFLPIYWFFRADISFWPWPQPFDPHLTTLLPAMFLRRANLDLFRVNAELLFIVLVWLFVPSVRRGWILLLIFLFYLAQLGYAVYEGFIRSYYLLDPVFYNDFFFFNAGSRYVLHSLHLSPLIYFGGAVLLALLMGLLFSLHSLLFWQVRPERLSRATRVALLGLGVLALVSLGMAKGKMGGVETAVTSFSAKLNQNIQLSRIAKADADRFDGQNLAPFYLFTKAQLQQKPDIYLIFLESYKHILYNRSDFRYPYLQLLTSLNSQLEQNEWAITSMRSIAPTWGGGSWLSYTSTMAGLRIDTHAQYLALFNRSTQEPFPHLFNYLRGQGYRSYWLSSNSDALNEVEWQRYKNFYGVDEWLQFADMQYDGPLYGWGPSPPDQYALHFAYAYMNQDVENPHVFFYITQNSHYPWTPLPTVAPDWQILNDLPPVSPPPSQRIPQAELRQQYLASIQYELTMLTNFIIEEGDDDDIFVVIGDHQPARVARYTDGWDTPIHIISKNASFVASFSEYGFVPGLKTPDSAPAMHHEGFYSLFMRNLLQEYGLDPENLPVYMPNGVPLH
jgi:hypothetical protein